MEKPAFRTLEAVAVAMDRRNVDTDQIIPARFLRKPRAAGMGQYMFHDLRFDAQGAPRADFELNAPQAAGVQILVARENFGSGSSREAAVYALWDFGFRVVIAPSFGDIFYSNSLKNGLLPIVLPSQGVDGLLARLLSSPGARLTVDLHAQCVIEGSGQRHAFDICPFQKHLLIEGQDELSYTVALLPKIEAFEAERAKSQAWI